jgi:putative pre-16S rRNA nuclease
MGFTGGVSAETDNICRVRILGIDPGRRRIGLAISDVTRTLARPLATLTVPRSSGEDVMAGARRAVDMILNEMSRVAQEDDPVGAIVVGLPAHLDGSASRETARVRAFIDELKKRTTIPVVVEDERLTSREAEHRLAVNERDWRKRKARLDAVAAAIILQDYLDRVGGAD